MSSGAYRTVGLVVAAGRGERVGGPVPKQYRTLAGESVVARSATALLRHPDIDAVAVVIAPGHADAFREACGHLPLLPPVTGGAERQASVLAGLEALSAHSPEHVLIHDAARPFVPHDVIDRLLEALRSAPAALPVLRMHDTLKRVCGNRVTGTVERSTTVRAQTPQAFRFAPILEAHRAAAGQALTDDIAVGEHAGLDAVAVEGSRELFKITRSGDLARAARHLSTGIETRTGIGYDVHRFAEGDGVTLCGIAVPHHRSLAGHSDADVGLHALTDALLGAIGADDIGHHFPPGDPQWRGADSGRFLAHAIELVHRHRGRLVNVDLTLVCERPKIGPYRDAMRRRLATLMTVPVSRVSVKATTTEGLGFTGRSEGIAACAVVSVALPIDDIEPSG